MWAVYPLNVTLIKIDIVHSLAFLWSIPTIHVNKSLLGVIPFLPSYVKKDSFPHTYKLLIKFLF